MEKKRILIIETLNKSCQCQWANTKAQSALRLCQLILNIAEPVLIAKRKVTKLIQVLDRRLAASALAVRQSSLLYRDPDHCPTTPVFKFACCACECVRVAGSGLPRRSSSWNHESNGPDSDHYHDYNFSVWRMTDDGPSSRPSNTDTH